MVFHWKQKSRANVGASPSALFLLFLNVLVYLKFKYEICNKIKMAEIKIKSRSYLYDILDNKRYINVLSTNSRNLV